MASAERQVQELKFDWANNTTLSNAMNVSAGVAGSILVPSGSSLIGKTVQFVAHSTVTPAKYADTDLLTTPKLLAAGSNPLTEEEILQVYFANVVKLKVNSAVTGASSCVLLWKS